MERSELFSKENNHNQGPKGCSRQQATDVKCWNCGGIGHISRYCHSSQMDQPEEDGKLSL